MPQGRESEIRNQSCGTRDELVTLRASHWRLLSSWELRGERRVGKLPPAHLISYLKLATLMMPELLVTQSYVEAQIPHVHSNLDGESMWGHAGMVKGLIT